MVGGIIDGGLFIPAYPIHNSGPADYDNVYMCSGSRATLDKLLDNVEKPDRKGDKDIKGFVKTALDHFESAAKKIRSKKYAEAVKEFSKLCKETSNAFEAVNNKTV